MYNTIFFPTSGHVAQWVNSLLCPARNTFSVSDVSAEDHQTQTTVEAFGAAGFLVAFALQAETSRTKSSNTQRTEYKTTDVVIHKHSRKLLKMDILMSETCWAHNKWNKIASVIKLIFHSSTNTVCPLNSITATVHVTKGRKFVSPDLHSEQPI